MMNFQNEFDKLLQKKKLSGGIPKEIYFTLDISPDQYLRYYKGTARTIVVTGSTGIRVKFPAGALRKHVTNEGIKGKFVIRFDAENKLIGVERV